MPLNDQLISRRSWMAQTAAAGFSLSPAFSTRAADAWPTWPLRLVVPFAPGGSSEIVARAVAGEMSKTIGQNVFVDNKPGAAGNIAMQEVANSDRRAHADPGSHRHAGGQPVHLRQAAVRPRTRTSCRSALLAKVPSLYVVHPDLPVKDLKEFVALRQIQTRPAQLRLGRQRQRGAPGDGIPEDGDRHRSCVHVPYRGTGPHAHRPHGRPPPGRVGGRARAAAIHQGRQTALHRHRHRAHGWRSCRRYRPWPSKATRASR